MPMKQPVEWKVRVSFSRGSRMFVVYLVRRLDWDHSSSSHTYAIRVWRTNNPNGFLKVISTSVEDDASDL